MAERAADDWWRDAVVYQCYLRSFLDSDDDGVGDLRGLLSRLDHLARLGVDALWINPCYPSPQKDAGYDVADYRDVDPAYGTLADLDAVVSAAHARGMRVLLDIVPNHTSDEHAWFRSALSGDPAARSRYLFRAGRGDGSQPPNDWQSNFGGPAWTRTTAPDGTPGDWYLHMFAPEQPDLDWSNPEVVAEFEDVLRFWFDRGVDGFRIDVAHGLVKHGDLPDAGPRGPVTHNEEHPAWDQEGVHEIYRGWRRVADSYDPPRIFVSETWVRSPERLARYVRPDELHLTFEFDLLRAPYDGRVMRQVAERSVANAERSGSPAVWVLANHDVVRQVTRYARSQPAGLVEAVWERQRWPAETADLAAGERRARAVAMLVLALPGSVYLYQGEELGLPEVEDLDADRRQDPMFTQTGGADVGRDGARVPMPWSGTAPPFGFTAPGVEPWLPQPVHWSGRTVERQERDPGSTLRLYRDALDLRPHLWGDGAAADSGLSWLGDPGDVLAFQRGDVQCWLNTGTSPMTLPDGEVVLSSSPRQLTGTLPPDTAVWLRVGA